MHTGYHKAKKNMQHLFPAGNNGNNTISLSYQRIFFIRGLWQAACAVLYTYIHCNMPVYLQDFVSACSINKADGLHFQIKTVQLELSKNELEL